jgi:stage II sporulation protein D
VIALLVLVAIALAPAAWGAELRVRVHSASRAVEIAGEGLRLNGIAVPPRVRVHRQGHELRWPGGRARPALEAGATRSLRVDGRPAEGRVSLRLSAQGGIDVVDVVPLERYAERAVSGEIYPDWPAEALKAQAVIARSYALHEAARRGSAAWDVEASVLSQRYGPGAVPASVRSAVAATHDEVLTFSGEPVLAVFHSASGGRTASALEVWGRDLPYLRSVASPDEGGPEFFWSYEIALRELSRSLEGSGYVPGALRDVTVLERSPSGRALAVQAGDARLRGHDLRQVLGGRALKSTRFEVRVQDGVATFLGSGAGHGVGMCQWGSRELARRGKSYREILAHYYPGTRIERLGGPRLAARRPEGAP